MNKYTEAMEEVVDDMDIEPLFTKEEEYKIGINNARIDGIEIGEKNKTMELAKNFKKQGFPLDAISRATGLTLKKLTML